MQYEELRSLLEATYDDCTSTLRYGSRVTREDHIYFYSLDEKYSNEVLAVRDALNSQLSESEVGGLTELTQKFKGDKWELPQCAVLDYQGGDGWRLSFHAITGVRYHKSYQHKVAATLVMGPSLFELREDSEDTCYGYWNRTYARTSSDTGADAVTDGINYRVNRNLQSNRLFRRFTISFFTHLAERDNIYVLKDICRTIDRWGYYLPSLSYSETIGCHTPAEIIALAVDVPDGLNVNFNRMDLNKGYIISRISPFIHRRNYSQLRELTEAELSQCITLKNLFDGFNSDESIEQFLYNYYKELRNYPRNRLRITRDYVKLCIKNGERVRLYISVKRMERIHDELAERTRRREYLLAAKGQQLISESSIFDKLEFALKLLCGVNFQRICTVEQLYNEGESQHNCVFARKSMIKDDEIAIFHWNYQNESITVQFSQMDEGRYRVDEAMAKYNIEFSEDARRELSRLTRAVNDM